MTLTQLEFARAVAETRSFTGAALACHVSQPSLSNALSRLEAELGGPLFARTTRRVDLTPLGLSLLPLIDSALESVRHLSTAAEAARNPKLRIVRLGLSPLVSSPVLAAVLRSFRKTAPHTSVILKQCFVDDIGQRLHSHVLDLAVVPTGFLGRGFHRCPFYTDSLQYLPGDSDPTASGTHAPVRLSEIADQTFVVTADGCGLTPFVRQLFRKSRHKLRQYPGLALNHQVIEEWVDLGLGAGLLPTCKLTTQRDRARPVVQSHGRPVLLRYELVWSDRVPASPQVTRMIEHFRVSAPKLAPAISQAAMNG